MSASEYLRERRKAETGAVKEHAWSLLLDDRPSLPPTVKVDPDDITPKVKDAIIAEMLHRNRFIYRRLSQI